MSVIRRRRAGQLDAAPTRDARAAPPAAVRRPPAPGRAPRGGDRCRRHRRPAPPRSLASAFGPNPFSSRILCCLGRLPQRPERVDPELVEQPPRALGPEPRQRASPPPAPAGTWPAASPSPESRRRRPAPAPSPGSSPRSRAARWRDPARASAATDTGASRTALAAFRYATTRWMIAPSSSYRSPSSSSASAISVFGRIRHRYPT